MIMIIFIYIYIYIERERERKTDRQTVTERLTDRKKRDGVRDIHVV